MGNAIAMSKDGSSHIVGETDSTDFVKTYEVWGDKWNGGTRDAFVTLVDWSADIEVATELVTKNVSIKMVVNLFSIFMLLITDLLLLMYYLRQTSQLRPLHIQLHRLILRLLMLVIALSAVRTFNVNYGTLVPVKQL